MSYRTPYLSTNLSLFLQLQYILHTRCIGLEAERIALTRPLAGGVRESPDKLHILTPWLVQPAALAQGLELHGAGGGQGVLLLEVRDGDGLHGLVSLHQQLPDLLQNLTIKILNTQTLKMSTLYLTFYS